MGNVGCFVKMFSASPVQRWRCCQQLLRVSVGKHSPSASGQMLWNSLRKSALIIPLQGSINCHINFITIMRNEFSVAEDFPRKSKFKCTFSHSRRYSKIRHNLQVLEIKWDLLSCPESLPSWQHSRLRFYTGVHWCFCFDALQVKLSSLF